MARSDCPLPPQPDRAVAFDFALARLTSADTLPVLAISQALPM